MIHTEIKIVDIMNYYDTLGCTKESTLEDIKRAYRALALKLHPDKNTPEFDSTKFQRILEAWHVLSNPTLKKEYDAVQKQEELDSANDLLYARISINELKTMDDDKNILTYPCSCGGLYCIQREHIQRKDQLIRISCLQCTFLIVIET